MLCGAIHAVTFNLSGLHLGESSSARLARNGTSTSALSRTVISSGAPFQIRRMSAWFLLCVTCGFTAGFHPPAVPLSCSIRVAAVGMGLNNPKDLAKLKPDGPSPGGGLSGIPGWVGQIGGLIAVVEVLITPKSDALSATVNTLSSSALTKSDFALGLLVTFIAIAVCTMTAIRGVHHDSTSAR